MSHQAYSILSAQLMATLIYYPFTVPLSGLADWSAFLGRNFANHVKSQLRQSGPWRALHGRYGFEIDPVVVRCLLSPQACLSLWLKLMDSQLLENRRYNQPPAAHPSTPHSCPLAPLYVPLVLLQWLCKRLLKSSSVNQLAEIVIKLELKDCSSYILCRKTSEGTTFTVFAIFTRLQIISHKLWPC